VARYEVVLENKRLKSYRRLSEGEDGQHIWYAYVEINPPSQWFNGQTYVDTLNKSATEHFLKTTHEVYKKHLGDDFGSIVPSIFTDEPQFAIRTQLQFAEDPSDVFLPWTSDFEATFQEAYQSSILDALPELIWDLPLGIAPSIFRYRFTNHICDRFVESYVDTIASWCRGNGLLLTGHMMEEPTLHSQSCALGEAMRCYRKMDLPGIDMLCDWFEFNTAKQAASVARQNGSPAGGIMCEIYGVTNWTFDFLGHKRSGDWQAALGVVSRVHHLTWVTMAGEAKRDYPASIGYQSPWYTEYSGVVEDHFARLNVALTRGRPICRVAVIHPIESSWLALGAKETSQEEMDAREEDFANLTKWLLYGLVDFDFISENLFPSQCPVEKITNIMPVGISQYEAVIVPNLRTIRSTTLHRLQKFSAAGGKVIVAGTPPELIDAAPTDSIDVSGFIRAPFEKRQILASVESFRDIRAISSDAGQVRSLLYQLRQDGSGRYLFICNTSRSTTVDARLNVSGSWTLTILDTFSGEERGLESTTVGDLTNFNYIFHGGSSLLLRLTARTVTSTAAPQAVIGDRYTELSSSITLKSVELSEPNVLLLDFAEYKWDDDSVWQPSTEVLRIDNAIRSRLGLQLKLEAFKQPYCLEPHERQARGKLMLKFQFESDIEVPGACLALEDAEAIRIKLNGNEVPSTVDGWWVDEAIKTVRLPSFPRGKNSLELEYSFGILTNIERVYILGDFGVQLSGKSATIVSLDRSRVTWGDYTRQGLPFYVGNVSYKCEVSIPRGTSDDKSSIPTILETPRFSAPVLAVNDETSKIGNIAYPPFMLSLGTLEPGTAYPITITSYGNRENAFGALHLPDGVTEWFGPEAWRSSGNDWVEEYNIKRMGLLQQPKIKIKDKMLD
jgi:hypothetical protein